MPHGHCYLWRSDVLWSNVIGDGLIALAYYTIPFLLYYFVRRRADSLRFRPIFILFALFIFACGSTHVLSIVSVWVPVYRLEGLMKVLTAAISLHCILSHPHHTPGTDTAQPIRYGQQRQRTGRCQRGPATEDQ